ncbi:MAG: hypothetical protein KC468_04220 [Myxococcales bacterium]|nr:hypothetical protein [Myxococcales bacterium]
MAAEDPKRPESGDRWQELLADPKRAAEILRDPAALSEFISRARAMAEAHEALEGEFQELQMLHEVTLEHSTDIEEQLAVKIEEVEALVLDLEVRNGFIREVFGRYMTDEVVRTLLESPGALRLGGEKRTITILMSDVRGFSSLCERLTPEQVVRTLNTYLAAMAEIITAHQGTINEFIGDAILAVFGAPIARENDAERAVACALMMQRAMDTVNRTLTSQRLPALEMGIGVHTGEVVVGNIGSTKRAKYGLVGSPVNLTSRIESYTVGGQVLVSDTAAASLRDRLITGESFRVTPKGIHAPLTIHEVLGIRGAYNITLPKREIELVELREPEPVELALVDGKDVGDRCLHARITALAPQAARLSGVHELEPRTDLKVRFTGSGAPKSEAIYAKVVRARPRPGEDDDPRRLALRFTSTPPAARQWIERLLDDARGAG